MLLDQWLETRVRMAHSQGILSRVATSPVQLVAAQIMMRLEAEQTAERFKQQFEADLMANDPGYWGPIFKQQADLAARAEIPETGEMTQTEIESILSRMREVDASIE